jgi:hypothetical protein
MKLRTTLCPRSAGCKLRSAGCGLRAAGCELLIPRKWTIAVQHTRNSAHLDVGLAA